jgi:acyl carrier protein
MTDAELLTTFTRILCDLLGDESIVLGMDTKRSDVPNWDSFSYVTFIAAVEMQLGIRFRVAAVESFGTVGDIVAETRTLLKKQG